ncbi:hypothetical protein DPMN_129870 [Dreissena polymorpha]|uniref:Uncharacterized protein n=1 Tax=Dreissena polymorpha TaxID=45954 RepID=A0A9D4H6N2_DREPO|nr:hypothetical protein DPMN_129870 [Dreissena polymorpha]
MILYLILGAFVVVGAQEGDKKPVGSVEFEQPTADVKSHSDVSVLNDADYAKYHGVSFCVFVVKLSALFV